MLPFFGSASPLYAAVFLCMGVLSILPIGAADLSGYHGLALGADIASIAPNRHVSIPPRPA
jgi:hypothetical protein